MSTEYQDKKNPETAWMDAQNELIELTQQDISQLHLEAKLKTLNSKL